MGEYSPYSVAGSVMPAHSTHVHYREPVSSAGGSERIYSAKQLGDALRSGLAAVKEQLGVLAILDGTAMSWPGVNQSIEDLHYLVDSTVKTTTTMDNERNSFNAQLTEALQQINTLRASLSSATDARDDALREVTATAKAERKARAAEAAAQAELQTTKQELWTTEKERADLATQVEKGRQDLEERDRQLTDSQATALVQANEIGRLREDLAGRKADVGHLTKLSTQQRKHIDHLKTQLDTTTLQLQDSQATVHALRGEKGHYEKEAHRLSEEAGRLSQDLTKAIKEVGRLKDWNDVMRKITDEKAQEQLQKAAAAKVDYDKALAERDAQMQAQQQELVTRDERLRAKDAELHHVGQQLALQNLNVKELQRQLAAANNERAGMGQQRDDARAAGVSLQSQLHALDIRLQEKEKARIVSDSAARESVLADRAVLTAKLDDALKEAAVHKALAEGWQRDIKSCQSQLQEAHHHVAALQATLQKVSKDVEASKFDAIKANVQLEAQLRALQGQLAAKEGEIKKVQFEGQSAVKALQKHVERLRLENDTAADEVQRLRYGDVAFMRLPNINNKRANSIQDDLAELRRALVQNTFSASPERILERGPPLIAGVPDALPKMRHSTR